MSNDKIKIFSKELDKEFNKRLNDRKNKKFILSKGIISGAMIASIAFLAACGGNSNSNSNSTKEKDSTQNTETTTSIVDLSDLGKELNSKTNNKSKDQNINEYVGSTGKVYVDEESANNASKVDLTVIDTQKGTLIVDSTGKVKEVVQGYEVKDEKGNVIDNGVNNGLPDKYAWDSVLGKYVEKSEVGKYVYSDATYYDDNGNIAIKKGDIVSKETLANAKKYFSTTKPTKQETQAEIQKETQTPIQPETEAPTTSNTNQGVVNADGTYTIDGMTYLSKADYQQCILQGFEGYAMINGIIQPEENIKQYQYTK